MSLFFEKIDTPLRAQERKDSCLTEAKMFGVLQASLTSSKLSFKATMNGRLFAFLALEKNGKASSDYLSKQTFVLRGNVTFMLLISFGSTRKKIFHSLVGKRFKSNRGKKEYHVSDSKLFYRKRIDKFLVFGTQSFGFSWISSFHVRVSPAHDTPLTSLEVTRPRKKRFLPR